MAAIVTLSHPTDGPRYGFSPRAQVFGAAAAAPHYNCVSRVIGSLACRISKIPCVGFWGILALSPRAA